MVSSEINDKIKSMINEHNIVLFMKGTKQEPMCGFSSQVINILNNQGVTYETVNILDDWDMREGIKSFSNWPTIPQLYVRGRFIGGCDIVMELERKSELTSIIKDL